MIYFNSANTINLGDHLAMQLNSKTGLTCLTCNLVFASGEIQRVHYVGEWHSYNIKRQIAGLPPVSAQDYQQKAQLLSQNIKENSQFEQIFCSNCRKNFQSAKAYENHLNSKKHKEIVEKGRYDQPLNGGESTMMANDEIERDSKNEVKDATMDERKAIPVDGCLFCPSSFKDLDSSLLHMSRAHGFLVPDFQYCIDLPGLITYLGMKVGEGRTCIRCNNNRFRDLASLHKHMRDKNHCNFRIDEGEETLLEFMDFYDYNDVNTGESDGEESENDNILYEDGCFLTLPSGARIGHRSLMRYFKQSLKPVKETDGTSSSNRALIGSRMKALGWTGLSSPLSVKHAKDMAFMKRTVQNYRLKQGMTNNKTFVSRGRNDQQ